MLNQLPMDETTDLIKEAFEPKTWNEIHVTDSWRVFKIISEFVEGFEKLARIGPSVAIFGSARTHFNNKYYKLADEIAFQLVQKGYGVISFRRSCSCAFNRCPMFNQAFHAAE